MTQHPHSGHDSVRRAADKNCKHHRDDYPSKALGDSPIAMLEAAVGAPGSVTMSPASR